MQDSLPSTDLYSYFKGDKGNSWISTKLGNCEGNHGVIWNPFLNEKREVPISIKNKSDDEPSLVAVKTIPSIKSKMFRLAVALELVSDSNEDDSDHTINGSGILSNIWIINNIYIYIYIYTHTYKYIHIYVYTYIPNKTDEHNISIILIQHALTAITIMALWQPTHLGCAECASQVYGLP